MIYLLCFYVQIFPIVHRLSCRIHNPIQLTVALMEMSPIFFCCLPWYWHYWKVQTNHILNLSECPGLIWLGVVPHTQKVAGLIADQGKWPGCDLDLQWGMWKLINVLLHTVLFFFPPFLYSLSKLHLKNLLKNYLSVSLQIQTKRFWQECYIGVLPINSQQQVCVFPIFDARKISHETITFFKGLMFCGT